MKTYFKGVLTGLITTLLFLSIPAVAQNAQMLLNQVAIRINGIDEIPQGEDLSLENGTSTPSSILYNDTTYLPLRKISELLDKDVYWNGDTKTVTVTDPQKDGSQTIMTEQPDIYGNIWTYYLFETISDEHYLGVKDNNRSFERVYPIMHATISEQSAYVAEDGIYFLKKTEKAGPPNTAVPYLYKLIYQHDEHTQDGVFIDSFGYVINQIVFDNEYLYYIDRHPSNGSSHTLHAFNCITNESISFDAPIWTNFSELNCKEKTETQTTLTYMSTYMAGNDTKIMEITVQKEPLQFGEPIEYTDY